MIENNILKSNFLGRDGFRWWVGQIAPESAQGKQINGAGWGNRLKVRILGYHPDNDVELTNEQLPWAHVLLSPESGSGRGNKSKSIRVLPGDNVFGFLTISDGIKVHKSSCKNALRLQSKFAYRILKAKWVDSTHYEFSSTIQIIGIDNLGLVNRITTIISENLNINMEKMSFDTEGDTFKGLITLKVKNKNIVDKLMTRLKKIKGVDKVLRF